MGRGDTIASEPLAPLFKCSTFFGQCLDSDLALAYGVENKRLNEQVKRNIERFPAPFRFQLTLQELDELVANCDFKWPRRQKTSPIRLYGTGYINAFRCFA
jgi:hypothetical protein